MARIVITGGAGFIGHHLVRTLCGAGHEVLVIDNFSYGKRQYLTGLDIRLVEADLATVDRSELLELMENWRPAVVYHLAGIHFIPHCIAHPDETFATNVRGTFLVAEAARLAGVKRIVFASTMDVYSTDDRAHSEHEPPEPSNIYGFSKALGERAFEYAARTGHDLAAFVFRFANIYGPEETNPHLIPDLLSRLRDRAAAELGMGDLSGNRDFLHVHDLCALLVEAITVPENNAGVFNVGSGISTNVKTIVDTLQRIAGDTRPVVEAASQRRSFVRRSLEPNMNKTFQTFRWRPAIALHDGLAGLYESEVRG